MGAQLAGTIQGGVLNVPAGSTTKRSPSISFSSSAHTSCPRPVPASRGPPGCPGGASPAPRPAARWSSTASASPPSSQRRCRQRASGRTTGATATRAGDIPRTRPIHAAVSASVVRSALSATPLKLSPSTFNSRAAVASISARSFSSRRWNREVKSHVDAAAALAVLDRRPGTAVRFESGPRRLLELVDHGLDLRVGRPVLGRPGDHTGGVLVLELQRVGDGGDHLGIPAADLDALAELVGRVALAEQVIGQAARSCATKPDTARRRGTVRRPSLPSNRLRRRRPRRKRCTEDGWCVYCWRPLTIYRQPTATSCASAIWRDVRSPTSPASCTFPSPTWRCASTGRLCACAAT